MSDDKIMRRNCNCECVKHASNDFDAESTEPTRSGFDRWTKYEKDMFISFHASKYQKDWTGGEEADGKLTYGINDVPPIIVTLCLGFQHFVTMFGSTIAIPFLMAPHLCIENNSAVMGELLSTVFFISGIGTILQSTVGCRLPIVQGATFAFLGPTIAILNFEEFRCAVVKANHTGAYDWKRGMREIQGAIIASSLLQVLAGATGLIGVLMRFIGPITIASTISLLGLGLFQSVSTYTSQHWGLAFMNVCLITITSQFIFPKPIRMIKTFPILLSIGTTWGISAVMKHFKVYSSSSDEKQWYTVVEDVRWIKIPTPWQWGTPTYSVSSISGMASAVFVSMLESVGNYVACARITNEATPPSHAINRGIAVEGILCLLAGLWGSGNGTTSYSENIATIGVTKVASRRVVQMSAVVMIVFSIFPKFGAALTLIPYPIIGGTLWVLFGMVISIGLSTLKYIDMSCTRNMFVLGVSMFTGMFIPDWIKQNKTQINTGKHSIDQTIYILLSSTMTVGSLTSMILDNLLPVSKGEDHHQQQQQQRQHKYRRFFRKYLRDDWKECITTSESSPLYDLPFIQGYLDKQKWPKYLPFLPHHPRHKHDLLIHNHIHRDYHTML